jgi:signal transduction histidine kinase
MPNDSTSRDTVTALLEGVSTHTGITFLEDLVIALCTVFDVDYALVGILQDNGEQQIRTISACHAGELAENRIFTLRTSPAAEVVGGTACIFASEVNKRFPEDTLLKELGAGSFIGIPLFASDGADLGLIALLKREPIANGLFVSDILQLFADRAVAEIERTRYEAELRNLLEARSGELDRAINELQTFSYSVSHDLRAPLRAINGYAEALGEDCQLQLDDTATDYLRRIRSSARRMERLIDDLLVLSRATRHPIKRSQVDLSAMGREILDQLHAAHPQRTVHVDLQSGIVANADPNLIRLALENLIGNAWKYTGKIDDGRIRLSAHQDNGQTVYQVQDNGAGFNMEYAKKLFEVFQRLHRAEDFEGSGVGLAIVKRIIERHGGCIWAHSREGEGASFYFTLPNQDTRPVAISALPNRPWPFA